MLTSPLKKPKRRIEYISTWLEAFSVYCLVLLSYFPHRWKDLLQYQLLILRTYRQFSGQVWLSYDRAFRENAMATNLTDWSALPAILWMAKTSLAVLLLRRSYANPGTGVIVWPLQRPAVLLTSVPTAMACTVLQFARLRRPTSLAHFLSVLLTLRLPVQQQIPSCVDSPFPPCIVSVFE